MKEAAARDAAVNAQPRESPVGDHQANGDIETAVKEAKRQVRTLRYATEAHIGRKLKATEPLAVWLPQAAPT